MVIMRYLLLIAFAVLLSSGQVLFKLAAMAGNAKSFPLALCNGWLAAALMVYAIATVLWVWILRTTQLSIAYPFVALGFVLVPLAAHYLFGEPFAARQVLGTLLIIAGLLAISG
jgi:multidrug transporter EmrE-like cation transporter